MSVQTMEAPASTRPPMWYDDFDIELYRVVPDAQRLIAPVAHVPLRTVGHPCRKTGRLNHPSLWNGDHGMLAFFGCRLLGQRHWKPPHFYTSAPVIDCTFEEAIRDTWVHSCLMLVDGYVVWNSWSLQRDFEVLMWHARGWRNQPDRAALARKASWRPRSHCRTPGRSGTAPRASPSCRSSRCSTGHAPRSACVTARRSGATSPPAR